MPSVKNFPPLSVLKPNLKNPVETSGVRIKDFSNLYPAAALGSLCRSDIFFVTGDEHRIDALLLQQQERHLQHQCRIPFSALRRPDSIAAVAVNPQTLPLLFWTDADCPQQSAVLPHQEKKLLTRLLLRRKLVSPFLAGQDGALQAGAAPQRPRMNFLPGCLPFPQHPCTLFSVSPGRVHQFFLHTLSFPAVPKQKAAGSSRRPCLLLCLRNQRAVFPKIVCSRKQRQRQRQNHQRNVNAVAGARDSL